MDKKWYSFLPATAFKFKSKVQICRKINMNCEYDTLLWAKNYSNSSLEEYRLLKNSFFILNPLP